MPLRVDGIHPFETASFDIAYTQAKAPTRGALKQVANLGPDLWVMAFQSHVLEMDQALQYQSWLNSLRGGARQFKAWHPLLEFPQAYSETGWSELSGFSGSGTLTDIASSRDEIDIADLPVGFELRVGDMLSIAFGTASSTLHRVMEDATADGSGEVTLTVEPIIPLAVSVDSPGQAVLFERPYCIAVVDADTIQGPWQSNMIGRVSFNAAQSF